jgi:uncharacterized membrane protein (UPF0136 family)
MYLWPNSPDNTSSNNSDKFKQFRQESHQRQQSFNENSYDNEQQSRYEKPKIFKMSLKHDLLITRVVDVQFFCTLPHMIEVRKAFATASVRIKSNESCQIHTDINSTNIEETQKNLNSMFNKIISRLKFFQDSSDGQKCDQEYYVPLYKEYCFAAKLTGELQVEYVFNRVDFRLIAVMMTGFGLILIADKLSKNELFHYLSGVSLGLVASILILVVFLWRYLPKKKWTFMILSSCSGLLGFASHLFLSSFKELGDSVQWLMYMYLLISSVISLAYCYYRGPLEDPRAINLVDLAIKLLGFVCLYCGFAFREYSIANMLSLAVIGLGWKLTNYNWPSLNIPFLSRLRHKYFPKPRKFLTEEEYSKEADEYTKRSLEDLKLFCASPECDKWKLVSRITKPDRFAKFVSQNDSHLEEREIAEWSKWSVNSDNMDDSLAIDEDENEA